MCPAWTPDGSLARSVRPVPLIGLGRSGGKGFLKIKEGEARKGIKVCSMHSIFLPRTCIGIGAQSTLRGKTFLPEKVCTKH